MSRVISRSLLRPLVASSLTRCTPMTRTIPITTAATITTPAPCHSTNQKRFMSNGGGGSDKPLYAPYTVFKTRGAMTVKFVPPVVEDRGGYQVLKRTGSIQIEMANASGERVYDWAKKEVFQLNVAEIGDILSQQAALVPITSTVECKYTHDPGLGSPDAGHIRKTFTIRRGSAPTKTPGSSPRGVYFVNLSIRTRDGETAQYNMQLSDGEFTIIAGLLSSSIPHLFAWSHVVTPQYIFADSPPSDNSNNNTSRSNNTASSEIWDK